MLDPSTVTPDQSAPTSVLGATTGADPSQAAATAPVQVNTTQSQLGAPDGSNDLQEAQAAQPTSRLQAIIQAVAKVGSTAMAGIPDRGRPSFVTGLGEGARSEQQAQATQQAIKFKTFDDSVRAAQLHNQDLEIQARTQAQADAHQVSQDAQHDWDEAHGLQYQEIPNSGQAATDYLMAQSGNGGASIPAGTHLSADGKTILIPKQSDETQTALLKKYQTFASAYNLPSLPAGAKVVPGKYTDFLQNKLEGKNLDGSAINHDNLPGAIADLQTTRASLAKQGNTDPAVLSQIDGTIGHLKENQTALDAHQAGVFKTQQAQQLDTLNKSEAIKAKYAMQKQDNAAGDKTTKPDTNLYEGTDASGNQVAGTNTELQAAGVKNFNKMPALTQTQTLAARELTSPDGLYATAANQIRALNQAGKLGPVASRWNNFWAGKGLDGDQQAFRGTLGLIASKLMQAHMGNKGGKDAMEHFAGLVPENSTPDTLMKTLNNEYGYVTSLAKRPKAVSNGQ
jgi:hypothetical protein